MNLLLFIFKTLALTPLPLLFTQSIQEFGVKSGLRLQLQGQSMSNDEAPEISGALLFFLLI